MRPLFEDIDEFDFDDSPHVARILREQRLEELRFASRKSAGPKHNRPFDNDEDEYRDFDDYEDYKDYDDYDDYDEREFDSSAGIGVDH